MPEDEVSNIFASGGGNLDSPFSDRPNFRINGAGEFQLFDTNTSNWRTIWFDNGVLQIGVPEA